ncbi:MAG: iron ABC transporter permease [Gammaproteobacteria bacterium]|nr:iron ABC transporter permease [Gammaproteobacteria bacterium]
MFARRFFLLFVVLLASMVFALVTGSIEISAGDLLGTLLGGGDPLQQRVIWELRLPRVASAFTVGALLALAGVLMQVLLRNPLAEPYILGVSGGAAAGALLALMAGMAGVWVSGSSLLGALISMLLVFALAHGRGDWQPLRLLLTGVVVAAGWGALISFLLAISPDQSLRGMLFWLMGDLSQVRFTAMPLLVLIAGTVLAMMLGRQLNLLQRGDLEAAALGVSITRLRIVLYLLGAVLTATAVMQAGTIGFVGLVIPHLMRIWLGTDHRVLLPASVLAGGSLVVLADTLARSLLAPQQLPVGVLTAFIGVPVFLFLMQRQAGVQRP